MTAPSGKRLGFAISAALLVQLSATEPVSASLIVSSSFPVATGFYVFGFDPVNPFYGLYPGLAFEFRTHSLSAPLESIRVSLNQFAGENEMQISLHEAEPYVDAFGVSTVRPGPILESFHLQDALSAATQIMTVESVLQPLLRQNTSYFISVVAIDNGERQLIRWSEGVDCEAGFLGEVCVWEEFVEEGFVRAFLSSSGSWGTYQYSHYPRTAFEVIAAPEPGTGLLVLAGLLGIAVHRRRRG
jgi:hypothetical protein